MKEEAFNRNEIEETRRQYENEAKEKWGDTPVWEESQKKTSGYRDADWARISEESKEIFMAFVNGMKKEVSDPEVQALVVRWQRFISWNFYECTDEILGGLGTMYEGNELFRKNMDKHGAGLASFMGQAINYYCTK